MVARQGCYAPSSTGCYLHHLLSSAGGHGGVAAARSRGVHYIIYVINKLGLAASTAFNAVNYLDRFLSINCHLQRWDESWMVELVSVACLSVACKLDEVNIPSLHHLQMEEVLGHSFRSATVRDMELTLLKALQWRLACVTPYSFLHYLIIPPSSSPAASARRCTRLLLRSLAEPSLLLRFDPSVIAASAIRCCVGLHQQQQQDYSSSSDVISRLLLLIRPADCPTKDDDECFKMMQALLHEESCCCLDHYPYISESEQQQPQYSSGSPVPGGIPFQFQQTHGGTTITAVNRSASVVTRRLFAGSTNSTYTKATKQP
ncbi:putative cyclin-D7-1 [Panicum miliaceum]|uniref:Cyclin-D7-1 n=1 Tax=Panicum miliaceum TaxID=4540 RepID=A0A3L6PIM4_PANMI|nr:putative cyclin-D7-1 [Panicum miliaceum]